MKSLTKYIKESKVLETFDYENLEYKIDVWYAHDEASKTAFYAMMREITNTVTINRSVLKDFLKKYDLEYVGLANFLMDNVGGTEEYEPIDVMVMVVNNLKANKSLTWDL